jgi:hypothetical protein
VEESVKQQWSGQRIGCQLAEAVAVGGLRRCTSAGEARAPAA